MSVEQQTTYSRETLKATGRTVAAAAVVDVVMIRRHLCNSIRGSTRMIGNWLIPQKTSASHSLKTNNNNKVSNHVATRKLYDSQDIKAYLVKDYDKKRLSDTFTSYDPAMWSIVPANTTVKSYHPFSITREHFLIFLWLDTATGFFSTFITSKTIRTIISHLVGRSF